jgi:hypothetical protein
MSIVRGYYKDFKHILKEHIQGNYDECDVIGIPLNVDEELYAQLENKGMVLGYALHDKNKFIGFVSIFIYDHPHHKDVKFAHTDCFYILPKYRSLKNISLFKKCFKHIESILYTEYDVKCLSFVSSARKDLTILAKRMGYVPVDIICSKKLGD